MSPSQEPAGHKVGPREALEQQIRTFFGGVAANPREKQLCDRCAKEMEWMDTTFSLYGTDSAWRVRVPLCDCQLEGRLIDADEGDAIEGLAS